MNREWTPDEWHGKVPHIGMARSIKRALDPNNILNPGKIFDV
jgi:FAD/FMN-containing dehydrogenase